jgi:hypothetical protein
MMEETPFYRQAEKCIRIRRFRTEGVLELFFCATDRSHHGSICRAFGIGGDQIDEIVTGRSLFLGDRFHGFFIIDLNVAQPNHFALGMISHNRIRPTVVSTRWPSIRTVMLACRSTARSS